VAPFGIWFLPFNIVLNFIELLAKPISLGMRLYGNMYAGELLFILIALLGFVVTGSRRQRAGFRRADTVRRQLAIFHILIVLLQAYIFHGAADRLHLDGGRAPLVRLFSNLTRRL